MLRWVASSEPKTYSAARARTDAECGDVANYRGGLAAFDTQIRNNSKRELIIGIKI